MDIYTVRDNLRNTIGGAIVIRTLNTKVAVRGLQKSMGIL
jgi:hypothetical protein